MEGFLCLAFSGVIFVIVIIAAVWPVNVRKTELKQKPMGTQQQKIKDLEDNGGYYARQVKSVLEKNGYTVSAPEHSFSWAKLAEAQMKISKNGQVVGSIRYTQHVNFNASRIMSSGMFNYCHQFCEVGKVFATSQDVIDACKF
jgi:hypothetical protein